MTTFPNVSTIPFEGPASRNPLAFRHYNPDELVEGKSMKEHLRFSVTYWHTFRAPAAIPSALARHYVPGTMVPRLWKTRRTARG